MAIFKLNQPIETNTPVIDVESPADDPLLPGTYIFQLFVVDDQGNKSPPVQAKVVVSDPGPTAVIRADEKAPFGKPFKLSGEGSSDVPPGKLVSFVWTLVERG